MLLLLLVCESAVCLITCHHCFVAVQDMSDYVAYQRQLESGSGRNTQD